MTPPTDPAVKAAREKAMKNARNRRYYINHRDAINSKRLEAYDPEKKRQYYYSNHDTVLASQRKHYKERKTAEKKERLNALLTLVPNDEGLKKLLQTHLENLDDIKLCEIEALEKTIILTVNKSE